MIWYLKTRALDAGFLMRGKLFLLLCIHNAWAKAYKKIIEAVHYNERKEGEAFDLQSEEAERGAYEGGHYYL